MSAIVAPLISVALVTAALSSLAGYVIGYARGLKFHDSLGAVTPLPAAEGGRPGGDGSGPLAAPRRDMPDEGVQR